jgi:thymidylate synthase
MVTAWDPSSQDKAVLPPCHYGFQIFIDGNQLDLLFNMRSVDWVLGCPADMTAYGFLQLAICRHLGKLPGKLRGNFGDTHIYNNHLAGAEEILRELMPRQLPQVYGFDINAPIVLFEIENTDFSVKLDSDAFGPSIHFPMAV